MPRAENAIIAFYSCTRYTVLIRNTKYEIRPANATNVKCSHRTVHARTSHLHIGTSVIAMHPHRVSSFIKLFQLFQLFQLSATSIDFRWVVHGTELIIDTEVIIIIFSYF